MECSIIAVAGGGADIVNGTEGGDMVARNNCGGVGLPKEITLQAGPHVVVLTHPDYQPYTRRVTIRPGETSRLVVDLSTEGVRRTP